MNFVSKIILTLLAASLSLTADIWRIEAGTGLWTGSADGTIDGQIQDVTVIDHLGDHKDQTAGYMYLTVKHPIPIIPNVRFEYTGVKASGTDVEVSGFSVGEVADSELFLTQYDTILFYNLLDKTLYMTFDVGADFKYVDSQYVVNANTNTFFLPSYNVLDESASFIVPMVYLRGRVDMPFAPLGLESDIKYITDGKSTVYDIRLKVDYTFKMDAALEPGIELGYRIQRFDIDGEESSYVGDLLSGSADTDVTFSGLYGGVTVKF